MEGMDVLYLVLACVAWFILLRYVCVINQEQILIEQRPSAMHLFGIFAVIVWLIPMFTNQGIWRSIFWVAFSIIVFLLPSGISQSYVYSCGRRISWKKYSKATVIEKGNYYRLLIGDSKLYYKKESREKLKELLKEISLNYQIEITMDVLT